MKTKPLPSDPQEEFENSLEQKKSQLWMELAADETTIFEAEDVKKQIDAIEEKLANIQDAYKERKSKLAQVTQILVVSGPDLGQKELKQAQASLSEGRTRPVENLLRGILTEKERCGCPGSLSTRSSSRK